MNLDFKTALTYPYRSENIINTLVFPSIVVFANMIISFIVAIIAVVILYMMGVDPKDSDLNISIPLASIWMMGYSWHLYGHWQAAGFQAPSPAWKDRWLAFLLDGLKVSVFYSVIILTIVFSLVLLLVLLYGPLDSLLKGNLTPEALGLGVLMTFFLVMTVIFAWFFLSPFFIAPLIHTSQTKRFGDLFNIKRAIEITLPCYGQVLIALLLNWVVTLIYLIGSIALVFTCIGILAIPFLFVGPYMVSCNHMLAQAFYGNNPASDQRPQLITPA